MDKISCNIIHDILPLYAENMVCQDTRKLVEEHITRCPDCSSALNEMKKKLPIQADESDKPLYSIRKKLRYRKAGAMLLAMLIAVTILILGIVHITSPIYLDYNESLISFKEYEDGSILVTLSPKVSGWHVDRIAPDDISAFDNKYDYHITLYTTLWNTYQGKNKNTYFILNSNNNDGFYKVGGVYYYSYDNGSVSTRLIYGQKDPSSGESIILPRLVLNFYKLIAIVITALGVIICLAIRKNPKTLKAAIRLTLIPASYCISSLCVTGFSSTTYSPAKDFSGILLVMIPLYLVLITAAGMIEGKKGM